MRSLKTGTCTILTPFPYSLKSSAPMRCGMLPAPAVATVRSGSLLCAASMYSRKFAALSFFATATYEYVATTPTGTSPASGETLSDEVDDMNRSVLLPFCCLTHSAAIAPPAPGLFSTITEIPEVFSTPSATNRAATDDVPPAANPTTNVSGSRSWVEAEVAKSANATMKPINFCTSFFPFDESGWTRLHIGVARGASRASTIALLRT